MRVIAGKFRSRILRSPKGGVFRPTSDRLRETLFNVLGSRVEGSRFVDLYSGTGAVGIEALSRGAAEVVFVESQISAATLIRKNLDSLGIISGATILQMDALRGLEKIAVGCKSGRDVAVDFVYLDPPWARIEEYERALRFLGTADFLSADACVAVEHRGKIVLAERYGQLHRRRLLQQGDAALSFYGVQPTQGEA